MHAVPALYGIFDTFGHSWPLFGTWSAIRRLQGFFTALNSFLFATFRNYLRLINPFLATF